jgi:hypothetical protein
MRCRPDFARIPPQSSAGAVLPTIAGTPQAQEAVIENSIPQTANRAAQERTHVHAAVRRDRRSSRPVAGTPLTYVTNSHSPIIQVRPNSFYSVTAGVLVHRECAHCTVDDRDIGAAGDLHVPAIVADLLRDVRADLRRRRRK